MNLPRNQPNYALEGSHTPRNPDVSSQGHLSHSKNHGRVARFSGPGPWISGGHRRSPGHRAQVARRVAAERGEGVGGSVGYAVRFDAVRGPVGVDMACHGMAADCRGKQGIF